LSKKFKFRCSVTRITVHYVKTNTRFWPYLAHFFLELEICQTNFVEKVKTHVLW